MEELTTTEKRIFDFIVKFIKENGYSPTFREVGAGTYLTSTQTIYAYLQKLALKGYIRYEYGKARTIRIMERSEENEREELKTN